MIRVSICIEKRQHPGAVLPDIKDVMSGYFESVALHWGGREEEGRRGLSDFWVTIQSMKLSALVFLAAVSCLPLDAEITVTDYQRTMRDGSTAAVINLKGYIFGAAAGIQAANSFAGLTKQVQLYCAPPKQTITGDDYILILNRAIAASTGMPGLDDMPISMLLMQGLITAYPCAAH